MEEFLIRVVVCTPNALILKRESLHVIKAKGLCRHPWLTSNPRPGVFAKTFFSVSFREKRDMMVQLVFPPEFSPSGFAALLPH
jgi:hypothetical protein